MAPQANASTNVAATRRHRIEKTAIENPDVQAKISDLGLQTRYLSAQEYQAMWADQETTFKELLPSVQQVKG